MELEQINKYAKLVEVKNQIQMYRVIIRFHAFLFNINLSITQETILCYLHCYGINEDCYRFILENKVVSNPQMLYNAITKLTKLKLVEKKGKKKKVVVDILKNKSLTEYSAFISIKLKYENQIELKQHE